MKNITELLKENTFVEESAKTDYPKNIIVLCEKIESILSENELEVELDLNKDNPTFNIWDPKSTSKDTLCLTAGISPMRR